MQSKVASLLRMHQGVKKNGADSGPAIADGLQAPENHARPEKSPPGFVADRSMAEPIVAHSIADNFPGSIRDRVPQLFAAGNLLREEAPKASESPNPPGHEGFEHSLSSDLEIASEFENPPKTIPPEGDEVDAEETTALAKIARPAAWSSAATTRDFLEQLASAEHPGAMARFWNARRGDIYLAIAVILVAAVIRWGIWSERSVSATGSPTTSASHRRPAPGANLSLFDRFLVSVGIAEAPETPEYKGNPDTQVWVDLHTALYYCPGTDLYGKSPKGKFTSQRDAQLDQFQPAYRKPCD
jgi:hypothetical protein